MRTGTITQAAKYDVSGAIRRISHDVISARNASISVSPSKSAWPILWAVHMEKKR
jgi:hypothetical protein